MDRVQLLPLSTAGRIHDARGTDRAIFLWLARTCLAQRSTSKCSILWGWCYTLSYDTKSWIYILIFIVRKLEYRLEYRKNSMLYTLLKKCNVLYSWYSVLFELKFMNIFCFQAVYLSFANLYGAGRVQSTTLSFSSSHYVLEKFAQFFWLFLM